MRNYDWLLAPRPGRTIDGKRGCGCVVCRLHATPKWRRWLWLRVEPVVRHDR